MRKRKGQRCCWLVLVVLCLSGFDFAQHSIPTGQILSGGPRKDSIPAILEPHFLTAENATFLGEDDHVLGVGKDGVAKVYPLRILVWHEAVNDRLGDTPVVATY